MNAVSTYPEPVDQNPNQEFIVCYKRNGKGLKQAVAVALIDDDKNVRISYAKCRKHEKFNPLNGRGIAEDRIMKNRKRSFALEDCINLDANHKFQKYLVQLGVPCSVWGIMQQVAEQSQRRWFKDSAEQLESPEKEIV